MCIASGVISMGKLDFCLLCVSSASGAANVARPLGWWIGTRTSLFAYMEWSLSIKEVHHVIGISWNPSGSSLHHFITSQTKSSAQHPSIKCLFVYTFFALPSLPKPFPKISTTCRCHILLYFHKGFAVQ